MKPINAEEIIRVFNGWLEEADSLAEREAMEYIYTYLGNGIRHELCMKFVQSGYDLGVIDEGTQAKGGQA